MPRRNSARARSASSLPAGPPTERELAWRFFGARSAMFVVIVLAVMALVLPAAAAWDYIRNDKFRTASLSADAKILDKQVSAAQPDGRAPSMPRWVLYRFTDATGVVHTSRTGIDAGDYDRLTVGGTWPVEYLPTDSSIHRLKLGGWGPWYRWAIAGGMAAVFAGLSVSALYFGRRTARRRAATVFHGAPVVGHVTAAELKAKGKARTYVVAYKFAAPDGTEQVGKVENVWRDAFDRTRVGQKVTVLVDPTNPRRHEPDLYGVRD